MQAVQQRSKAVSKKRGGLISTKKKGANANGQKASRAGNSKADDLFNEKNLDRSGMAMEDPMSAEDKERVAIVKQIQDQIIKRGEEATGSSEEEVEIERLLHGYVSMCHNASMEFMKSNKQRAAGRMLHQCGDFIERGVPPRVAAISINKGIMHTVYNNLAQHANMVADMSSSIQFLEKALQAAERPEADQDLLPLAETYLNLANGYSFLNKYDSALVYSEKALKFAQIRCSSLREEIQDERSKSPGGPNPKLESLDYQLNDFIAIKVMGHLCVGEQHEKLCSYNAAIKSYSEGKQFAETNFGTRHPLYTKCVNAMGGARLKSKYQTKDNFRAVPSIDSIEINKKMLTKAKKAKKVGQIATKDKKRVQKHEDNPIRSKLIARREQNYSASLRNSMHSSRRNIKQMINQTESQMTQKLRNHQDNLLLSNCDSWTSMHCRHLRPRRRQSMVVSVERKRLGNIRRPMSATRSDSKVSRSQRLTHGMLDNMTESKRAPYKVMCKVGPSCNNHDWTQRSPLRKVCTRGPGCSNHDWDSQASIRSMSRSVKTVQPKPEPIMIGTASLTQVDVKSTVPERAEPIIVDEIPSSGNHSCMLQQTERIHQQQMQHMRTMQDDQFKMLQLVVENQQAKQSSSTSQVQNRNQSSYMYYPQSNMQQQQPMFYQQQGSYPYFQSAGQQQQWHQGNETDVSCTETEQSDVEQVQEGRRPAQSELSQYDQRQQQAFAQQQQQMQEMEKRMSAMQAHYQEQIDSMRVSHDAYKVNNRHERTLSASSERRVNSYKDFKEDSDINERGEDVLFGGSRIERQDVSQRSSIKEVLKRDQSAQVMDSLRQQNSILKQSTMPSKLSAYNDRDHRTVSPNKSHESDMPRRNNSASVHSVRSRPVSASKTDKSAGQTSFLTEKSFRIPYEQSMSKDEAAVRIQKNFKAYRERQDYRFMKRRGDQKKFLFRATVRGATPQIISCSVHSAKRGKPTALSFVLQEARRPQHNVKMEIDLRQFDIRETTDLKDKVLRIIREALASNDIITAIQESFESDLARDIIEADFFSSDDQFTASAVRQTGIDVLHQASTSDLQEIHEEEHQQVQAAVVQPQFDQKEQVNPVDQQILIDAEIERIRKRCDIRYRVNVEQVVVEGHKRDFESNDQDEDRPVPARIDSDVDEREININRVDIRRVNQQANSIGSDESELSQHEYEFVMGKPQQKVQLVKKLSMRQIILVQAMVRGFLSRLYAKYKRHVIICKILRRQDELIRFTLTKNMRNDYTLMAQGTLKRSMNKSKHFSQLPFADDDAKERFEQCLLFSCDSQEITQLDLVAGEAGPVNNNPFIDMESHNFILDYDHDKSTQGHNIIKSWRLRDEYPCELIEVICVDKKDNHFRVVISHQNLRHYMKLNKLPVDMFYMAYYLNELLYLNFDDQNVFTYLYMLKMMNLRDFIRRMGELEVKYFGMKRSAMPDGGKSLTSISASSYRLAVSQSRKFTSTAGKVKEFIVTRHINDYVVEVYDETEKTGKFKIYVKRRGKEDDNDWISVTQVTLFLDDLIKYLKENLKVELRNDGTIDYLSLAHSYSLFNQRNLNFIQKTVKAARTNSQERMNEPANSANRDSVRSSQLTVHTLSDILEEFTIERNNRTYNVSVQERLNVEGLPLQIRVTSEQDSSDTKYMVYKNNNKLEGNDLTTFLSRHMLVYTRWDAEQEREMIDYVSITQQADEFRRSATMSLSSKDSSISKRNMVKARAGKFRDSHRNIDDDSINIQDHLTFERREQDNTLQPSARAIEVIDHTTQRVDGSWVELTRQFVNNSDRRLLVNLYGKAQQNQVGRTRVPQPRGQKGSEESEFLKILVVDPTTSKTIATANLSVAACQKLLKLDSQSDLQVNKSAFLTITEIMRGKTIFDARSLEQVQNDCAYQSNKQAWNHIIKNVSCDETSRQVKFDVWSICQTLQSFTAVSESAQKIKTVSVSSKLTSQRSRPARQTYTYANALNSAAAEDERDSVVDGNDDNDLSEQSVAEDQRPIPKFKIVHRASQHAHREVQFSPSSRGASDFPDEEQEQMKCQGIVKTAAGQFLNVILSYDGQDFLLTATDRVRRSHKLCENFALPNSFIEEIPGEGGNRLTAVKRSVDERLKTVPNVQMADGRLDTSIFN